MSNRLTPYLDKIAHASLSAFLVVALSLFLPVWVAVVITLSLGAIKEIADRYMGGECSIYDLIADLVGIVVGCVPLLIKTII